MVEKTMLTTVDNPYNPFLEFSNWYAYDVLKGYNSCELLARIAKTSVDLPENLARLQINKAIDSIVELNPNGLYKKVTQNDS